MELNREQIIKALEYCNTSKRCFDCPYRENECDTLFPNALSLIKELNEEAQTYKKHHDIMDVECSRLEKRNDELTEENERLRANNKQLVNDNAELKNQIQEEIAEEDINLFDEFSKLLHEGIREAKADTVRKMQERLKEAPIKVGLPLFGLQTKDEVEDYANGLILQTRDAIDQIAKEMLEEGK